MFKKPLNDLKTSAPLRSSDRRRLKQRIIQEYSLSDEHGELLVPEGLQSVKFSSHTGDHGVAYLSSDGDPLWFTIGKGNDDLVPTVYTLWNKPDLLPLLSTPAAVIPVLIGGADLMIPGVVQHTNGLHAGQLVSVTRYERGKLGPPLAVGRMAVDEAQLKDGAKGKAVHVVHTYKDKLWELGSKADPPEATPLVQSNASAADGDTDEDDTPHGQFDEPVAEVSSDKEEQKAPSPPASDVGEDAKQDDQENSSVKTIPPQDVSDILRTALIQAIRTTLSKLPPASFPMPSSSFYTAHILPSRPAFIPAYPNADTPIDIKHSSFKSLTAFLKSAEKDGLLRLKEAKGKGGGEAQILGVFAGHPDVQKHQPYKTVAEAEARKERQAEKENEGAKTKEVQVTELWKPHQQSIRFFEEAGKQTSALYTYAEVKAIFNAYVVAKNIINPTKQMFINVNDELRSIFSGKSSGEVPEFLKREEAIQRLLDKMQPWHRIEVEGKDPETRKGELKPIFVIVKLRQGRKACTLITNFEPYFIDANALAEELRHLCASSTSVSPLPGKNSGLEVMVQGKQIKAVTDLLLGKGIPKKWIESADLTEKKK